MEVWPGQGSCSCSFGYSFSRCLWSACCVPGPIVRPRLLCLTPQESWAFCCFVPAVCGAPSTARQGRPSDICSVDCNGGARLCWVNTGLRAGSEGCQFQGPHLEMGPRPHGFSRGRPAGGKIGSQTSKKEIVQRGGHSPPGSGSWSFSDSDPDCLPTVLVQRVEAPGNRQHWLGGAGQPA